MKQIVVCAALLGLCAAGFAEDKPIKDEADVLNLIKTLEKAGFKVTPAEKQEPVVGETAEAKAAEEMIKKLETPIVSVEYKASPLADVLSELQKVTGVNILLDPKVQEARQNVDAVTLKLEKVKAISVLQNLLKMYDLVAVYGDEALMVTLPVQEEGITLVYDVHELTVVHGFSAHRRLQENLRPCRYGSFYLQRAEDDEEQEEKAKEEKPLYDPEALIALIKKATPSGNWDNELYSITHANGMLVVTQRPEIQVDVANILSALKTRM